MQENKLLKHKNFFIAVIVISIITVFIYSVSLDGPFVFDDYQDIKQNPNIHIDTLSFQALYQAAFNSPDSNRPVANLSYAFNYYIHGLNVRGYHWFNIIVHIINGLLVFILVNLTLLLNRKISIRIPAKSKKNSFLLCALFAALIFICHPIQTQAVSFIVQRMTIMATMFCLVSLLFYILGRLSDNTRSSQLYFLAALISWLLALGSKQNAVIFPVIIILYEWFFFRDLDGAWMRRNLKYTLVAISIMICVALLYLGSNPLERIMQDYEYRDFTIGERLLTQFRVIVIYLGLLLFPHPERLNLMHDVPVSVSLFSPITTLFSLILLAGVITYAIVTARRYRIFSFCILWFFICLVIESSIIGLELIYEHRLYLPMFAFSFAMSLLLMNLLSYKTSILVPSIMIIISLLVIASYQRNKVWANPIDLWSDVISKNPGSHRAHYNYANILTKNGRAKEAVQHFMTAIDIEPSLSNEYIKLSRQYFTYGNYKLKKGDLNNAKNNYLIAKTLDPLFPEPYNNLGNILVETNNFEEAFKNYKKAIELSPDYTDAHVNMGNAYLLIDKFDNACKSYHKALQLNPYLDTVRIYFNNNCNETQLMKNRINQP